MCRDNDASAPHICPATEDPSPEPETLETSGPVDAWQQTLELLGLSADAPPDEEPLPPRGVKSPKPQGPPMQLEAIAEGLAGSNAPGATNPLMQRKAPLAEVRQERRRKLSKKPAAKRRGTKKAKRRKRLAPRAMKRSSFRRPKKQKAAARRAALEQGPPIGAGSVDLEAELALLPRRPGAHGPPGAAPSDSEQTGPEVPAASVPAAAPLPEEAAPQPAAAPPQPQPAAAPPQPPAASAVGATLDADFANRLRSLALPEAAFRQETRGQHSYTLKLPGPCVIEVQLPILSDGKRVRAGCFLIKRPELSSGRSVPWLANGGVAAAWDLALARAGCTLLGRDG
jgi:hypothetical protein